MAAAMEMISSTSRGSSAILLSHVNNVGFSVPSKRQAALRPSMRLKRIGERFRKRTLGGLPFLGVHLRRNEFLRLHPESVPSAAAAAARLNHLLRSHGLEQVFVATDGRRSFCEELRALVEAPLYYFAPDDGGQDMDHAGYQDIITLQILAEASVFVGTSKSAFSAVVHRERSFRGTRKARSEVFCGNLTEASAERRCTMAIT